MLRFISCILCLIYEGEYRAGSFYTHKETGDVLEELGADTTLGEDLGRSFRRILDARP